MAQTHTSEFVMFNVFRRCNNIYCIKSDENHAEHTIISLDFVAITISFMFNLIVNWGWMNKNMCLFELIQYIEPLLHRIVAQNSRLLNPFMFWKSHINARFIVQHLNEVLFEMIELRVAHSTHSDYFHTVLILYFLALLFLIIQR